MDYSLILGTCAKIAQWITVRRSTEHFLSLLYRDKLDGIVMKHKHLLIGTSMLVAGVALAACGITIPTAEATRCPDPEPCIDCPAVESCPDCPECPKPEGVLVPFEIEWANSPHNDVEAEAFRYWDENDPAEIPTNCAKCHSTPGYIAFMGVGGSEFGVVEEPAPIGTTVECVACHNEVTLQHDSVVFPSGLELIDLGDQASCIECHQGRGSKMAVDANIAQVVGEDLDIVSENLSFISIHLSAAGVTRYGTEVKGGYEYDGEAYDPRFDHVEGYQSCIDCHDMHTLELKVDECGACHQDVTSLEDVEQIRSAGSLSDYDGDGDVDEPIKDEIAGLQELLYQNIQTYAAEIAGTPIVYDSLVHPYFFDVEGENYTSWTGRLVRAAYNYQVSQIDRGAFAHGGKYVIQLLYDSIADLTDFISTPVDLGVLHRDDPGHFAASNESWRQWDEDRQVSASCSKCHSAEGLPYFITSSGDTYAQPAASGLNCATCHDDLSTFTRYLSEEVEFPSGAVVSFDNVEANLCINCHQGRHSTIDLKAAIASSGAVDDEVTESLAFSNPHFFAAGATLFGTEVQGAYEYAGQTYNGRFLHVPGFQDCIECHSTHLLKVKVDQCAPCHGISSEGELPDIRMVYVDFDGDGDPSTGLAVEVMNVTDSVYEAIVAYAADVAGTPIVFDSDTYPYWFVDKNGNGMADADESISDNGYVSWTPRLLRVAYNYTWAVKDPGSYAHNGLYILQILYDTLQDIGGDVSNMTRPEVTQ